MKAVGDLPVGSIEPGGLFLHRPVTRQGPVVQPQLRWHGVRVGLARSRAAGRCEVFGTPVARVVFR